MGRRGAEGRGGNQWEGVPLVRNRWEEGDSACGCVDNDPATPTGNISAARSLRWKVAGGGRALGGEHSAPRATGCHPSDGSFDLV